MSNLLEYIWNNIEIGHQEHDVVDDTYIGGTYPFAPEVGSKDMKEGIYIFRKFNDLYHPTAIQPELFVLSVDKLARYHEATTRIERDTSKDWLLTITDPNSVLGKAIAGEFGKMAAFRGVDLLKDFDVQLTVKGKATIERTLKPFTKTDFNKAFKKITFKQDENGITNEEVEDIDLFVGLILKNSRGGNYVFDLGDFYIKNREHHVNFDDLLRMMREYATAMIQKRRYNLGPKASAFDHASNLDQTRSKLEDRHKTQSEMRVLTQAVDFQSKGKIKVRQPDSIGEESIMINKLVRLAKESVNPSNQYDQMYRDLESIYDPDSIEHVIKTSGDAIALKGKLYLRLGDKFFWNVATVQPNGHSIQIHEPMLISSLYSEYTETTVSEYLANWINVNDLGIRL